MTECVWCHDPVDEQLGRWIDKLIKSLGDWRREYVKQTWGEVPAMLCAHDFCLMSGQTNIAMAAAFVGTKDELPDLG